MIVGSAGQLQQVVMNLMENALDAMNGAGVAQPKLSIRIEAAPREVLLRVRDNGPGIPADNLSRIFEPFFTTKPVGKGTGLGLSISYGIVEQHGGQLTAGNPPGGGAEFVARLRAAPD